MNSKRHNEIRNSLKLKFDETFLQNYIISSSFLLVVAIFLNLRFSYSPVRFLSIPLITVFMFRSFAFMHEAVHCLLTKNLKLNQLLGVISGTFCLLSFESWKQAHLAHHKWSGNVDKDPVAAMIKRYPNFSSTTQGILSFGWRIWFPALSLLQHSVFWGITVQFTLTKKITPRLFWSAIVPILFWVCLVALSPAPFIVSILLPSILLYLIGTEIINAPHHLGLEYFFGDTQIPISEQFKIARSCVYPEWISKWIVLNFNYHIEHHMYPFVPCYHLDKLHSVLKKELGSIYNQDPSFSWTFTNRKKDLGIVFGSDQVSLEYKKRVA
ncbi:MAG: fatty acid desaturase [Xanthomonadaceae bacterium]|nr:fatty acid desaturase [Xanthomonadaceae bacterium]